MDRPELYEELKLFRTAKERSHLDTMADLYSIIQTLQALEKAFYKDLVDTNDYTTHCSRLLSQVKAAHRELQSEYPSVENFMAEYKMDASAALERIKEGRPITVKDASSSNTRVVADIVAAFITVSDNLRLNIRAKDELYQPTSDLLDLLNRMSSLPDSFESKKIVKKWLDKLDSMAAQEELSETDARQFLFDIDNGHATFTKFL